LRRKTPGELFMVSVTPTYIEWLNAARRRERRIRYGVALVILVLPTLVAWVVMGAFWGAQ
jgi:hypothetical protein